jgi:hypothetical protein
VALGVFTAAELAGTLFRFRLLDGHPLSIAIWFVWLAATTSMLAFLSWKAFGVQNVPERDPLPAGPSFQTGME